MIRVGVAEHLVSTVVAHRDPSAARAEQPVYDDRHCEHTFSLHADSLGCDSGRPSRHPESRPFAVQRRHHVTLLERKRLGARPGAAPRRAAPGLSPVASPTYHQQWQNGHRIIGRRDGCPSRAAAASSIVPSQHSSRSHALVRHTAEQHRRERRLPRKAGTRTGCTPPALACHGSGISLANPTARSPSRTAGRRHPGGQVQRRRRPPASCWWPCTGSCRHARGRGKGRRSHANGSAWPTSRRSW